MRRKEDLTFLIHPTQYERCQHTMDTVVVILLIYTSVYDCIGQNLPTISTPGPFGWPINGPPPRTFSTETHGSSSNHHHVVARHPSTYHPRNIQDILRSIMESPQESKVVASYAKGSIDQGLLHHFRPEDPSEINLMAPNLYRFSPPVWKNFTRDEARKVANVRQGRFPKRQGIKDVIPGGAIRNGDIDVIKANTYVL